MASESASQQPHVHITSRHMENMDAGLSGLCIREITFHHTTSETYHTTSVKNFGWSLIKHTTVSVQYFYHSVVLFATSFSTFTAHKMMWECLALTITREQSI